MPSWDEIINQVESAPNGVIDITRKEYISKLAEIRGRNVICYYSGWLQDSQGVQETSLLDTDMTGFMTNVHELDRSKGLDLILHTPDALRPATRRSVRAIASNAEQAESSKPSIRGSTLKNFNRYSAGFTMTPNQLKEQAHA